MPKFIEMLICYEPQMFRCDEMCQYGMTHRMKDYIELDGEVWGLKRSIWKFRDKKLSFRCKLEDKIDYSLDKIWIFDADWKNEHVSFAGANVC